MDEASSIIVWNWLVKGPRRGHTIKTQEEDRTRACQKLNKNRNN